MSAPWNSALLVNRAHTDFPSRARDAGRIGIQRDLQDAVTLMAEHIEGFLDIVECEPVCYEYVKSTRRCSTIVIRRRMRSLPSGHNVVTIF